MTLDPANFGELPWRGLRLHPDKAAIEQDDLVVTYAELEKRIKRTAAALAGLGIGKGDRVLLLFHNDHRFAECLLGVLRTGAVAVPANVKLGRDPLTYIAEHSESVAAIGHAELVEQIPPLRDTLVLDGSYDDLVAAAPEEFATAGVDRDRDEALLMYTSGSTGRPKGVRLSHANKWWQAASAAETMMWKPSDKGLVTGPLYHANALWACLLPMLYVGGSVVILPGFEPRSALEAIDRYRPTYTSGTPSMYAMLLAERETLARCDVSSIDVLECGSAPVPEELMVELKRTFGCEVCETYGLTEGGATLISPRWGIKKLGSTGLPVPGVEIRIVSPETGGDCAPSEVGELWSRCGANALGYHKAPDATAEKFTADGWLKTGDLVTADEQGYVYFRGRVDDMISVGGENVYPKEVETILLEHPAVADVCVVPVPHSVKGAAPVAWVVLHAGEDAGDDELKEWFLARGPAYAHPRRVFFLERLPVSGTNKVDRKGLTDEAARRLPHGVTSVRA